MQTTGVLERRLFLFICLYMAQQDIYDFAHDDWYMFDGLFDNIPFGFFQIDNINKLLSFDGYIDKDKIPLYYNCTSCEPDGVLGNIKKVQYIFSDDIMALKSCGCIIKEEAIIISDYSYPEDSITDTIEWLEIPKTVKYAVLNSEKVQRILLTQITRKYVLTDFFDKIDTDSSLSRLLCVLKDILSSKHHFLRFSLNDYVKKYATNKRQFSRDMAVLTKLCIEKSIDENHIYTIALKREKSDWDEIKKYSHWNT